MKVKSFCLDKTEGANNHIEQGNALIFARHPISVTYNQLPAMLTIVFHYFSFTLRNMPTRLIYQCTVDAYDNGLQKQFFLTTKKSF